MNVSDYLSFALNYGYAKLYFNQYNKIPFLSQDEIQHIQLQKLRHLIDEVTHHVPFYKPYRKEIDINRFELKDLAIFPIVNKEIILRDPSAFINHQAKHYYDFTTSGSSGNVLKFRLPYFSKAFEFMTVYRHLNFSAKPHYKLFEPILLLRSYSPKEGDPIVKYDRKTNLIFLSPYHINKEHLPEYIRAFKTARSKVLKGYPSSIYIFTELLKEQNIQLEGIETIITSSEILLDKYKKSIEEYWKVKVMDWYGQNERTVLITQSSEGIYYNHDDYGYPEIINNEIIATSLNNHVFPFIRYNTEDRCEVHDDTSKLTKTLGIHFTSPLKKIEGRSDDILIKVDGTSIPSINIYTMFYKIKDIKQFKITQNKDLSVTVYFVLYDHPSNQYEAQIIQGLRDRLGEVSINLIAVDEIKRDLISGKVKTIENLALS